MEKEGVRDRPALHVENRSKGEQRASFLRLTVQKEMLVITGIHLSVPFIKKGNCELRSRVCV